MTLIVAARCRDGAIAIADKRSHISTSGNITFDDSFEKVRIIDGFLVCNHGYNRINDKDWKDSRLQLAPDEKLPIYASISSEMKRKQDKFAAYLFLRKNTFFEIEIEAGGIPIGQHRKTHDRIKRGNGQDYVNLEALVDLPKKRMKEIRPVLEEMFRDAYKRQEAEGGTFFSPEYTVTAISG